MKLKHVIWDWNGTLIDDAHLCVEIVNGILVSKDLAPVTLDFYRDHFHFPVSSYYELLGLTEPPYDLAEISKRFITNYRERSSELLLQPYTLETLSSLREMGIRQSVLSAGLQSDVQHFLKAFDLDSFMHFVSGVDNVNAEGKSSLAQSHFLRTGCHPNEVLLVGDTILDDEIAQSLSVKGLLVTNGHNSPYALRNSISSRIQSLSDFSGWLHC
jgi:phosphoglycolate phosphatase|tara:strand:- start:1530 stop:2171 length:642 start_codon:yes stop_codon:yes gene_type:complete